MRPAQHWRRIRAMSELTAVRRFCRPLVGDTMELLAARELPAMDAPAALSALAEWNAHLANRRAIGLLVSDVVFLEGAREVGNASVVSL